MKQKMIRHTVKRDRAAENERLIAAVFDENKREIRRDSDTLRSSSTTE
jgi:hypothetical protein